MCISYHVTLKYLFTGSIFLNIFLLCLQRDEDIPIGMEIRVQGTNVLLK